MNMSEITRIPVSKETRATLKALGSKGESYDAVIRRLILDHELLKDYVARIRTLERKLQEKEAEE